MFRAEEIASLCEFSVLSLADYFLLLEDKMGTLADVINQYIVEPISTITFADVVDILLLGTIIYILYRFIRERRGGKLVLGLLGVLAIKSGLSTPLKLLFGNEYVARAVRYFLIVGFAGAVWPLTFKWFSTLKIDCMERFTAWVSAKLGKKSK